MTKKSGEDKTSSGYVYNRIFQFAVLAVTIYLFTFILNSTDKGVDWTDESWVYELNSNLSMQLNQTWGYQYFGHLFILVTGGDVLLLRILRLSLFIVVNYILVYQVGSILLLNEIRQAHLHFTSGLIALLSTFFSYAYFPRSVGYNELTAWIAPLIFLVILKLISEKNLTRLSCYTLYFLLGLLNSLLFFIKFSSGVILTGVTFCFVLVRFKALLKSKRIISMCFFLSGILLIPLAIQIASGQAFFYVSNVFHLLTSPAAQADYGHSIGSILPMYFRQFIEVSWTLLKMFVFPFSFILIGLKSVTSQFNSDIKINMDFVSFVLTLFLVFYNFPILVTDKWLTVGNFTFAITIIAIVYLFRLLVIGKIELKYFACLLLLTLLPFIQAFGTNNPIGGQTMIGNVGLLIVVVYIGFRLAPKGMQSISGAVIIGFFAISIGPSLIHGTTVGMYRVASIDALDSKIEEIDALKNIYVTKEDKTRYDWLAREIQKLPVNSVHIPLGTPGYNYAINNQGFAAVWTDTWWPVTFSNLSDSCKAHYKPELPYVLITPSELKEDLISLFNSNVNTCGFRFPENFIRFGEDPTKSITIWISDDPSFQKQ